VLARSPLGARFGPVFVWDGSSLLELGGSIAGGGLGGPASHGAAAYDPATRRWRRLASAPAAVMPAGAAAVWTGRQVFVFGRPALPGERDTKVAGLYDPATNRWTVTARAPIGDFANQPTAVWTGTRVILAGMGNSRTQALEIAGYNPATNTWSRLAPPTGAAHPTMGIAIVATNDSVLLWSLWGRGQRIGPRTYTEHSGVDVFRLLSAGGWTNVTGSWPQNHTVDAPIFTGSTILVAPGQIWCGACSHPAPFNERGYLVDPASLHITPIPHGPFDDVGPQIIWTGAAEISFNTGGTILGPRISVRPGDIAIWSPATFKWARGPRAPKQIGDAPAVWSPNKLFVLADDGTLLAYGR
jgi:hypothetical protein